MKKRTLLLATTFAALIGLCSLLNAGSANFADSAYFGSLTKNYTANVPSQCSLSSYVYGSASGGSVSVSSYAGGPGGSISNGVSVTNSANDRTVNKINQGSGIYYVGHMAFFSPAASGFATLYTDIVW